MAFNICMSLLPGIVHIIVNEGILEGELLQSNISQPYYSFKGIPYAEPPLGNLRFKAPLPKQPWNGVRTAKEFSPKCYQYDPYQKAGVGSEDCLYLNVYTPHVNNNKTLPVMVWIYGGGLVLGDGGDDTFTPDFLLRKNVVVVTLNYRLDILGYLSLDTEDIPGNAGMKDQVEALRWVKKNIGNFGGDPDNITIFGGSAGAACVSFHLVSPMSKGLFNRAIIQSGTLITHWANAFQARERALILARELGCSSSDDKEIYEFLKVQPVDKLVNRHVAVTFAEAMKATPNIYFSIVSETLFNNSERFFYGDPFEVLRNGIHDGLEIMNGYTKDEGTLYFLGNDPEKVFSQANTFLEFFVPNLFTTTIPINIQMEIGKKFKNFYMGNELLSKGNLDRGLNYLGIDFFVYGTLVFQKIIAKKNQNKNYLYKFTCNSERNPFVIANGLEELFDYRPVVSHGDEIAYIFSNKKTDSDIDMESNTFKMIDQVTTLWTNFAKYGDPTHDNKFGVRWLPYTIENQDYMDIGQDLIPKTKPEKIDMEFWEENFRKYLPKYAP